MKYNLEKINSNNLGITVSLDYLTGVISRENISDFANYYIDHQIPFSLYVIDIDNFKHINDRYGHLTGDIVLKDITSRILEVLPQKSAMGRFGGDEFLILVPHLTEYQEVWDFCKKIYGQLRYNFRINENETIYITATTGSVAYPKDGSCYEDLFLKADKALYRGKQKGRNCYIIYLEEKHGDIFVNKNDENQIFDSFNDIYDIISTSNDIKNSIIRTFDFLNYTYDLKATFIPTNKELPISSKLNVDLDEIKDMMDNKPSYVTNVRVVIIDTHPITFKELKSNNIDSFTLYRVGTLTNTYGYILFYYPQTRRIWQKEELVLMNYIANTLALKISK